MEHEVEYKDLGKSGRFGAFQKNGALAMLKETIQTFFNCEVSVYSNPTNQIKSKHGINIHDNPRRGFYPIDNNNVVIIGRVLSSKKMISAIGFCLSGERISQNVKLLNKFEGALTGNLTQEYNRFFQYGTLPFGDELIKHTITNYISMGFYDFRNIAHLIEFFFKLRTTSFEGQFFSTGVIISKALHDFIDNANTKRHGHTLKLSNWLRLRGTNLVEKRIWFLADGKKSFFLGGKNLDFTNLFVVNPTYFTTNYVDTHSLALTLKGGDALFKIENEKLFSINTSGGFEFLFFENQWRFRNYNFLKQIIEENISDNPKIVEAITFYLLNCSKKQISSILWFPSDLSTIDQYIQVNTKNTFLDAPVNLADDTLINHIFRCLSSDGATVIDREGNIKFFGVIIELSKISINGLKGTGESAASALTTNGVSIKISQDGVIKVFTNNSPKPFIF